MSTPPGDGPEGSRRPDESGPPSAEGEPADGSGAAPPPPPPPPPPSPPAQPPDQGWAGGTAWSQPGGQGWGQQPPQQQPAEWRPPPTWGQPQWGQPAAAGAPPQTSGLAVGALIASILGFFSCGVGFVIGLILGYSARSQIRGSGGAQAGDGAATGAIVIGWIGVALTLLGIVAVLAFMGLAAPRALF